MTNTYFNSGTHNCIIYTVVMHYKPTPIDPDVQIPTIPNNNMRISKLATLPDPQERVINNVVERLRNDILLLLQFSSITASKMGMEFLFGPETAFVT
jgi:hypothetical protein